METRTKPFIIIIVLGIVGFMFWLYAPTFKQGKLALNEGLPPSAYDQLPPPPPPPPLPPGASAADVVYAVDTITNGKHSIRGAVKKQSPCDTLTTAVSVGKSKPEAVSLALITTAANTATCSKTTPWEQFTLSFAAGSDATISASVNGKPATIQFADPDQPVEFPE